MSKASLVVPTSREARAVGVTASVSLGPDNATLERQDEERARESRKSGASGGTKATRGREYNRKFCKEGN